MRAGLPAVLEILPPHPFEVGRAPAGSPSPPGNFALSAYVNGTAVLPAGGEMPLVRVAVLDRWGLRSPPCAAHPFTLSAVVRVGDSDGQ